jgi:hypothetical protein
MALAIVAIIGFIALKVLTRMHGQLVTTFSETFVGGTVPATPAGPPSDQPHRVPAGAEGGLPSEQEPTIATADAAHSLVNEGPYTETTDSPVSLGDAEIIALSTVSRDRAPYRNRLKTQQLAWDLASVTEDNGYYRIKLTFREADSKSNETGEEEIYVDQRGNVRLRQITRWPPGATNSVTRFVAYTGVLVLVLLSVGAGVLAFLLWGPQ